MKLFFLALSRCLSSGSRCVLTSPGAQPLLITPNCAKGLMVVSEGEICVDYRNHRLICNSPDRNFSDEFQFRYHDYIFCQILASHVSYKMSPYMICIAEYIPLWFYFMNMILCCNMKVTTHSTDAILVNLWLVFIRFAKYRF